MWATLVAAVAVAMGDSFARVLRRRDVVALAFGAMIGWSWIILTGEWIETAGRLGAIAAFLAGGVAIGLIGLTYAELAAGYGSVTAFEAVALPTVIDYLIPGFSVGRLWSVAGWDVHASWVGVGALGALVVTALNVLGVRPAAVFQTAATAVILAGGALLIAGASLYGSAEAGPPLADGLRGVLVVLMMVPFMFVGFDVIPQSAEEIALPYHEIGRMLILSVALAVVWYAAIIASVGASLDAAELGGAKLATAQATATVWGRHWAGSCLLLAGAAGIVTSWNAFLVGGSRAVYALAAAWMLPAFLGRLHPRFRTPHNAVILIGALSCLAPLFGRPALLWLVNAGSLGIVLAYAMVALSFLVLRGREPGMERPFRVRHPKAVGGGALILSLGLGVLYVPGGPVGLTWPEEWAIVLGWSLLGAALFAWAKRSAARAAPH
jgi:amino acid transporter